MKSALAVLTQLVLSGTNYIVFILMARKLDEAEFVAFSTAMGLNMFSYALSEGGLSYVAPKALAERNPSDFARLAGAFMLTGFALYILSMAGGWLLWNKLAEQPLSTMWVLAYAIFFAPALWMPSWITSWLIDRRAMATVIIVRAIIVITVAWRPNPVTLAICGLAFCAQVLWLLRYFNLKRRIISFPSRGAMRLATYSLRSVFVARTISYTAYAALPLVVGVVRGGAEAATYITAERLKSLYATLFQPFIQALYLWQVQSKISSASMRVLSIGLQAMNVLLCILMLVLARHGWLGALGQRFTEMASSLTVWLAAGASVSSACLLMFHIFPDKDFVVFRRAAAAQLLGFLAIILLLWRWPQESAVLLLLGGEVMLLLALSGQMLIKWNRK